MKYKEPKIIENLIDINVFKELQKLILSDSFPWYWYNGVVNEATKDKDFKYNFQLIHGVYFYNKPNSDLFDKLEPILEALKVKSLIRIKLNLQPRTSKIIKFPLHIDNNDKFADPNIKTTVWYLNTNNGYTFFENGKKVLSKENTAVEFNSNIRHSGTTCTNAKCRVVMNLNYF
jgi:hypothetical protein